jgi:hypothetical protein
MEQKAPHDIVPARGGFFKDLLLRIKLVLRLMGDSRVNFFLKLIPIGSLLYLFFPDLAPGPVDDAAVIWLGTYLFVEMCPPAVVEEHMAYLTRTQRVHAHNPYDFREEEEIIEGEFREET